MDGTCSMPWNTVASNQPSDTDTSDNVGATLKSSFLISCCFCCSCRRGGTMSLNCNHNGPILYPPDDMTREPRWKGTDRKNSKN